MIVKDEINIITRCLNSVKNVIDYWVICDTGSTDGTQKHIIEYFKKNNIPGELHETPWKNFGYNRTVAFEKAKDKGDFFLVIDADDIFIGDSITIDDEIPKDAYYLTINHSCLSFKRTQLFNAKHNWRYVGVLHEYPECDKPNIQKGTINNCSMQVNTQGSRSSDKLKYKKDAEILLKGIQDEPTNSRYHFYLANSYYDNDDYKNAKFYYNQRIKMGGWDEEVYYSMYKLAVCKHKLLINNLNKNSEKNSDKNYDKIFEEEILCDYLKAFNYRKSRLEALYEIVKYYRKQNSYLGYGYGMLGYKTMLEYPENDILFINEPIHKWKFIDELSVCAWFAGNYILSLSLMNKLINMNIENHNSRFIKNKQFCIDRLAKLKINIPSDYIYN